MTRPSSKLLLLPLLAGALWVLPADASRGEESTPAAQSRSGSPEHPARGGKPSAEPLSEEDAALVRELALVERVELLRNLELFEPIKRAQGRSKKGSP